MQDCVQGPHQLYGCNFFVSLHMPTCKELLEKKPCILLCEIGI